MALRPRQHPPAWRPRLARLRPTGSQPRRPATANSANCSRLIAGLVEQVLALAMRIAQRFQVVLHPGQRIGQRVQLAPAGHLLACRSTRHGCSGAAPPGNPPAPAGCRMRIAPATSASRRGTGSSAAWSQSVSTKATNALRTSAKFAAASRASAPITLRDSCASRSSASVGRIVAAKPAEPGRPANVRCRSARRRRRAGRLRRAGGSPSAMPCTTLRCSWITPRAASSPSMPRVSPMRSSASACGCRSAPGRRRRRAGAGRARP